QEPATEMARALFRDGTHLSGAMVRRAGEPCRRPCQHALTPGSIRADRTPHGLRTCSSEQAVDPIAERVQEFTVHGSLLKRDHGPDAVSVTSMVIVPAGRASVTQNHVDILSCTHHASILPRTYGCKLDVPGMPNRRRICSSKASAHGSR